MSLLVLACFLALARVALLPVHGAQTFWPAAIPFAVRTPYLNTWMYSTNATNTANAWPSFWHASGQILGWICYIRVDGKTYSLFGYNNLDLPKNYSVTPGTVLETELTPTRTIQVIEAGPMNVTVTFLSPIDPSDLVRQSMPFAYTAVDFESTDNQQHDVQLYADLTGEWLYGGSRSSQTMSWSSNQTSNMFYHQLQLSKPVAFQDINGQASDGTLYHAMALGQGRNITWQACEDTVCRTEFIYAGGVNSKNNNDTFRDITDDWPVFPISVNLGNVASSTASVVWVVGYVRNPSISYTLSGQTEGLRPYYTTQYSTVQDALEYFVSDFNNSLAQAKALDKQVCEAAASISADGKLFDMLSFATRPVFSSLEITAPEEVGGQPSSSPRIFMKDLGLTNRVTPVENLYAALPMFLYYNASLVKPLLVPLLEQQNSSTGAFLYAASDIGQSFPTASNPTLTAQVAIEQTGNMLMIALAHAQYANDTSLLHDYYGLFKDWAEYLSQNALYPADQMSMDTAVVASNLTNLAVNGIYGIQAMAQISHLVGASNDSQQYSSTASTYMNKWQSLALSSGNDPSVFIQYGGAQGTWSLPYNLYAETLFGFGLLNQTFFDKLTVSYGQRLQPSSGNDYTYGLPVESSYLAHGNAAWNAFMAATFTNDTVRALLLDAIWGYASNNATSQPFGTIYSVESGNYVNGSLSPALGGLFAPFLHSGLVSVSHNSSSGGNSGSTYDSNGGGRSHSVGAIAGGVVGGVVGLLLLVGLAFWLLRGRKPRQIVDLLDTTGTKTEPTPFEPVLPIFATRTPTANVIVSEKRQRELLAREGELPSAPPSAPSSSTATDTTQSGAMLFSSSAVSGESYGPRHDELLGLRSDIEDLRRIMLSVHVERPEPSELGAPPDYS